MVILEAFKGDAKCLFWPLESYFASFVLRGFQEVLGNTRIHKIQLPMFERNSLSLINKTQAENSLSWFVL